MATLFISDLHLDPTHPEMTELFLAFLQKTASSATALYILGDFFEVWVGDDDESMFNQKIKSALKNLVTKGVALYIMHGNRDFLLGKKFIASVGAQLLADPTVINLYGIPALLMHGDTLCTTDTAYLKFRKKVRNPIVQNVFLKLPLTLRKAIAKMLRGFSQGRQKYFIDAELSEVKKMMLENNARLLIHGHTHWPSIQYFNLNGAQANRIVLSDWENTGNVLIVKPDGTCHLQNFKNNASDFSIINRTVVNAQS